MFSFINNLFKKSGSKNSKPADKPPAPSTRKDVKDLAQRLYDRNNQLVYDHTPLRPQRPSDSFTSSATVVRRHENERITTPVVQKPEVKPNTQHLQPVIIPSKASSISYDQVWGAQESGITTPVDLKPNNQQVQPVINPSKSSSISYDRVWGVQENGRTTPLKPEPNLKSNTQPPANTSLTSSSTSSEPLKFLPATSSGPIVGTRGNGPTPATVQLTNCALDNKKPSLNTLDLNQTQSNSSFFDSFSKVVDIPENKPTPTPRKLTKNQSPLEGLQQFQTVSFPSKKVKPVSSYTSPSGSPNTGRRRRRKRRGRKKKEELQFTRLEQLLNSGNSNSLPLSFNSSPSTSEQNRRTESRNTRLTAENLSKSSQQQQQNGLPFTVVCLLLQETRNDRLVVRVEEEPLLNRRLTFPVSYLSDEYVPYIECKTRFLLGVKFDNKLDTSNAEESRVIVLWARIHEYIGPLESLEVHQAFLSLYNSDLTYDEIIKKFYFSWRPFVTSVLRQPDFLDEDTMEVILATILPDEDLSPQLSEAKNHQLRLQEIISWFSSPESTFLDRLGQVCLQNRELVKQLIELVSSNTDEGLSSVYHLLRPYYFDDLEGILDIVESYFEESNPLLESLADQNFRNLPLIPVMDELKGVISSSAKGSSNDQAVQSLLQLESHLLPNIIDGPWDSPEEFLNVHFRLLREECFASIRERIASIRRLGETKNQQIHRNVKVVGYAISDGTIVVQISYQPHKSRANMMYGNLLCIDVDETFSNPIWATVKFSEGKSTQIAVTLVGVGNDCIVASSRDDISNIPSAYVLVSALQRLIACKSGVMVESPTYYNAFRPVLSRLQSISEEDFPFSSEILLHSVQPKPSPMNFSFSYNLKVDDSQLAAVDESLKNRFSLIQGPPGCGKTFVGKEIVQIMLKSKTCDGPILLMTYKNHALDSFLENCLEFTQSVVRIGGRSTSEAIAKFNLHNLSEEAKSYYPKEEFSKLKDARGQLLFFKEQLEVIAEKSLVDITAPELLCFLLDQGMLGKLQLQSLLMKDFPENYGRQIRQNVKYSSSEEIQRAVTDILENHTDLAGKLLKDALNRWLSESESVKFLPKPQSSLFIDTAPFKRTDDDEESDDVPLEEEEEEESEQVFAERFVGNESKLNFSAISHKKNGLYKEVQKRMTYLDPDERESHVCGVSDLWCLSHEGRYVLLSSWIREWRKEKEKHLSKALEEYNRFYQQVQELEDARSVAFLKSRDIVACTITGCCLRIGVISQLAPSVVIVEEAAEILESQLIASLPLSVKHLVLIGDHKQLPPQVRHYRLAKEFNLGVSIFERLAKNGYPVSQLRYHRRGPRSLCPLFSRFYTQEITAAKEDPKPPNILAKLGLMYWWTHDAPAKKCPNGTSFENEFEATMLVGAVRLLTWKGQIDASRISIITGYLGQAKMIKKLLEKDEIEGVTVCTIDRFQGDENDFIFLSLTRSVREDKDDERKVSLGFLASSNRTCVALSRARIGLYIFGCSTLFATHPSWQYAVNYFRNKGKLGHELCFNVFNKEFPPFEHPNDFSMLFKKLEAENQDMKLKVYNKFVKELPPGVRPGIHDVSAEYRENMEKLMNMSVLNRDDLGIGRDADGIRFSRFKVNKVRRIFNKEMYCLYLHHQKMIGKSKPPPLGFHIDCTAEWMSTMLNDSVNEVFLFHGTTSKFVNIIAIGGFDERVANLKGMYGAGTYFAENADKSDHYAKLGKDKEVRYMLLARVTLGRPYKTVTPCKYLRRPPAIDQKNPIKLYDSIIAVSQRKAKTKAANVRHQEFVVFDKYQCLPEFIIEYQHQ